MMDVTVRGNYVYITGEKPLFCGKEVMSRIVGDSRLFVKMTNIEGIFIYGCEQLVDEYMGHKAGYIWASRASCMNKQFGCALVECCYKTTEQSYYTTCAIDLAHLEPLLEGSDYMIDWKPIEKGEDDIYYCIMKKTNI